MSYKSYEHYKISGINLIKNIPLNWNIFKLKFLITSLESGKRKDFEDENYALSLDGEHINWDGSLNLTNKRFISRDFYNSLNNGKVEKNDILLVKDGATIGKTAFVENLNCKMAVNEHVFIIRNNILIIPKLLYYLISSNIGFSQIKLTETGSAQGGINQDIKDKVLFPFPKDINEQLSLVKYLDNKIGIINKNISKNKELISLLEEKKVALINKCVTKGLNPNVPMKDSGVEWIGEIPEHWEVRKMKNLIFFQEGPGLRNWQFTDKGIRVICVTNITERGIDFSNYEKFISEEEYSQMYQHFTVQKGDLLLSSSGNSWGKVAEYVGDETLILNTSTIRINESKTFKNILNQSFIKWALQSEAIREQLGQMMTGSCQPNFGPTHLAKVLLSFPNSDNEQKEIADYLDKKINNLNLIIWKIEKNIGLLEEYKQSLIYHVVTGKVDVREEKYEF